MRSLSELTARPYRAAKEVLYSASGRLGVNRTLADSAWRRRRLLILCYHGVALADEHDWSDLFVSAALLERRLQWLRRHDFTIVSLADGVRGLADGTLPHRAVAITFDDGFHDFHRLAAPLLGSYRAPATVYLTTYHVDVQLPVFNPMLSYLLWKGAGRRFHVRDVASGVAPAREDVIGRWTLQQRLVADVVARGWSVTEKDAALGDLATQFGIDFEQIRAQRILSIMNAEEVRSLDRSLIDVQLHTHRHRTPAVEALFKREIRDNRHALRALVGDGAFTHFCYPSGHFTRDFGRWLEDEGVTSATTCETGLAAPDSHPLFLPRLIDAEAVSDRKFAAWASGTAALLDAPVRLLRPARAPSR